MEVMIIGRGYGRGWSGWFVILMTNTFLSETATTYNISIFSI